jgi:hypothetical protein
VFRIVFCFPVLVALGLVAAGSAGAVTITSWVGGSSKVPQLVTAAGNCPGTVVTITGTGFVNDGGPVSVTIGGVAASPVIVGSDTTIFARVGAGATSGTVVVTTKAGSATSSANAIVYPCQATGAAASKPTIDTVSPQRAKSGKKLRLLGSGFVGAQKVTVNGAAVTYAIPSDNLMYVIVPAGAKTGLDTIEITTGMGSAKVVFQKTG